MSEAGFGCKAVPSTPWQSVLFSHALSLSFSRERVCEVFSCSKQSLRRIVHIVPRVFE